MLRLGVQSLQWLAARPVTAVPVHTFGKSGPDATRAPCSSWSIGLYSVPLVRSVSEYAAYWPLGRKYGRSGMRSRASRLESLSHAAYTPGRLASAAAALQISSPSSIELKPSPRFA